VRLSEARTGPVTSITSVGNRGFGMTAIRTTGTLISDVHTAGNGAGGLDLNQVSDATVADLTATDEPTGVFTRVASSNIMLDRLAITGGRRGVAVEKTTKHVTLQDSTIEHARVAGVAVAGSDATVHGVAVSDSGTNLRVERGAEGVTASGLHLSGGRDGVVAMPGTRRLLLHDLDISRVENDAIRSFSPDTRILGGTITGATTGINADAAPTTIAGTRISLVDNGIQTRAIGPITADNVDIQALRVGIDTGPTNPVLLTKSHVHALESVRGQLTEQGKNDLSLPPLNLIGAIGLPLVLLAIVLQLVHLARQPRTSRASRRWAPPPYQRPPAKAAPTASRPTRGNNEMLPREEPRTGDATSDRPPAALVDTSARRRSNPEPAD
jgi:hypothetical protein